MLIFVQYLCPLAQSACLGELHAPKGSQIKPIFVSDKQQHSFAEKALVPLSKNIFIWFQQRLVLEQETITL